MNILRKLLTLVSGVSIKDINISSSTNIKGLINKILNKVDNITFDMVLNYSRKILKSSKKFNIFRIIS